MMCNNSPWLDWMSAYSFRGFLMWCCRIVINIQIIRWLIEEKENRTVNLCNDLEFAGKEYYLWTFLSSFRLNPAHSHAESGLPGNMGLKHCPGLKQVYFMDLDMMSFRFSYLPNELNKIRSKLLIGCRLWCSIIGWSIQLLNTSCWILSCCLSIPIRPT